MVRGQADFGMYAPKEGIASLADMADLAVRLGSIVEYDRRGDVVWLDDFESPLPKFYDFSVGTGSVKLDTEAAYSGAQSLKFLTEATIAKHATAKFFYSPLISGRHGIKISFSPYELPLSNGRFRLFVEFLDGVNRYNTEIALNPYAGTLSYMNASQVMVVFDNNFYIASGYIQGFHNMKLVVDYTTKKYVRLMIDTLTWDMSEFSFWHETYPTYDFSEMQLILDPLEAAELTLWVDDLVYTINEP